MPRRFGRRFFCFVFFFPDGVTDVQPAEPAVRRGQRSRPTPQQSGVLSLQSPQAHVSHTLTHTRTHRDICIEYIHT